MVTLQLLVVLSPAYRRPPPGTHPSRFPHHTTTWAANLISMVFRIRHPKRPGAGTPAKGKPCLSKPLPRLPRPSGTEGTHHTKAAKVLSMVFGFVAQNPLGIHPAKNQRPCLSELLLHRGHHRKRRGCFNNRTAHLISLDFWEMPHHNPPIRAANLISMVFRIHHPKPPGAGAPAKGKPCLAFLLPT